MSTEALSPADPPIEARSSIPTADGPLDVVARNRGEFWRVDARCADRHGTGIGRELGIALLSALELCGVDAAELDR